MATLHSLHPHTAVIPVSRHAKTGTHTRAPLRMDLCEWVPARPFGLSGMTAVFQFPHAF